MVTLDGCCMNCHRLCAVEKEKEREEKEKENKGSCVQTFKENRSRCCSDLRVTIQGVAKVLVVKWVKLGPKVY